MKSRRNAITQWPARVGVVGHLTGADTAAAEETARLVTADVLAAAAGDVRAQCWPADATPADVANWLTQVVQDVRASQNLPTSQRLATETWTKP